MTHVILRVTGHNFFKVQPCSLIWRQSSRAYAGQPIHHVTVYTVYTLALILNLYTFNLRHMHLFFRALLLRQIGVTVEYTDLSNCSCKTNNTS